MYCWGNCQDGQQPFLCNSPLHPTSNNCCRINCLSKPVKGLSCVTSNSWAIFWFCSRERSRNATVVQQRAVESGNATSIWLYTQHTYAHRGWNTNAWKWMCCRNALQQSCAAGHRAPTYSLNGILPTTSQCQTRFTATTWHEYFKISHEYFFQACRLEEIGIEPLTFRSVDDVLYIF